MLLDNEIQFSDRDFGENVPQGILNTFEEEIGDFLENFAENSEKEVQYKQQSPLTTVPFTIFGLAIVLFILFSIFQEDFLPIQTSEIRIHETGSSLWPIWRHVVKKLKYTLHK